MSFSSIPSRDKRDANCAAASRFSSKRCSGVLGPPRERDQIEISRTDEFTLGVDAPVRISGDLRNAPGITVEGPAGRLTLPEGVISARRHR